MKRTLLSLFLIFIVQSLCVDDLIVKTNYGSVEGFYRGTIRNFLGVPFASPPTGSLRWQPPQPPKPWQGVKLTTSFAPACMQFDYKPYNITTYDEDCLYLNIYAPTNIEAPLPVMLWIYGGSFTSGSGQMYDGNHLATVGNVIVVTINYRLGPFGYLSLESLLEESNTTGNYGMQDQRYALQYVRENIGFFGGDPARVTIFGESAGAISTCFHIVAPLSKGLFWGALMESGFCDIWPLGKALNNSRNFTTSTGCQQSSSASQLSCLRALDSQQVLYASPSLDWFPVVDGYELSELPEVLLEKGDFNEVPLLLGTNLNEASYWECSEFPNITAAQLEGLVEEVYGSYAEQILQMYPIDSYSQPVQALTAMQSDAQFICPTMRAAIDVSAQNVDTYRYVFAHKPGFSVGNCLGVSHTFELPFIWPNLAAMANYTLTAQEEKLSLQMVTYWTNFATNLNPNNGTSLLTWPLYTKTSDEVIVLDIPLSTETGYNDKQCTLWGEINPQP